MSVTIIDKGFQGPLYNNNANQLKRAIGPFTSTVNLGFCGTVVDDAGKHWDWWETDNKFEDGFREIKVMPAT
jgi:hypothetical protein